LFLLDKDRVNRRLKYLPRRIKDLLDPFTAPLFDADRGLRKAGGAPAGNR
jgi:hypothetical protein